MGARSSTSIIFHTMVFVFTFVFLSLATELHAESCTSCPAGWQQWQFSCYKSFYPAIVHWENAVGMCQELGGHLATPNSDDEYDFMWNNFNPGSVPDKGMWIGCTDEDGDGVWECIGDTKEVRYRLAFKKPVAAGEKCAVVSRLHTFWGSYDCTTPTHEKYVMCERPIPVMTHSRICSHVAADRCMLDYTFKTLYTARRGVEQCCLVCLKEEQCRSFNLRGNQCELINSTVPVGQLSEAVSCIHFTLK